MTTYEQIWAVEFISSQSAVISNSFDGKHFNVNISM